VNTAVNKTVNMRGAERIVGTRFGESRRSTMSLRIPKNKKVNYS